MIYSVLSPTCQIPNLNAIYEKYFADRIGTFVEVGGNDGLLWSNTWGLAEAGWTGLYLEPVGELVKQCRLIHAHNKVTVIQTAVAIYDGLVTLYRWQWGDHELSCGEYRFIQTC